MVVDVVGAAVVVVNVVAVGLKANSFSVGASDGLDDDEWRLGAVLKASA